MKTQWMTIVLGAGLLVGCGTAAGTGSAQQPVVEQPAGGIVPGTVDVRHVGEVENEPGQGADDLGEAVDGDGQHGSNSNRGPGNQNQQGSNSNMGPGNQNQQGSNSNLGPGNQNHMAGSDDTHLEPGVDDAAHLEPGETTAAHLEPGDDHGADTIAPTATTVTAPAPIVDDRIVGETEIEPEIEIGGQRRGAPGTSTIQTTTSTNGTSGGPGR
jgi:hypothetical protein